VEVWKQFHGVAGDRQLPGEWICLTIMLVEQGKPRSDIFERGIEMNTWNSKQKHSLKKLKNGVLIGSRCFMRSYDMRNVYFQMQSDQAEVDWI
jgi:hypothetical protein